jgi:hypothetical protein
MRECRQGAQRQGPAQWLPPGLVWDRDLWFEVGDFRLVLSVGRPRPAGWLPPERPTFAPGPGKPLSLPEDVRPLAAKRRLSGEEAKQLEQRLREALRAAGHSGVER